MATKTEINIDNSLLRSLEIKIKNTVPDTDAEIKTLIIQKNNIIRIPIFILNYNDQNQLVWNYHLYLS